MLIIHPSRDVHRQIHNRKFTHSQRRRQSHINKRSNAKKSRLYLFMNILTNIKRIKHFPSCSFSFLFLWFECFYPIKCFITFRLSSRCVMKCNLPLLRIIVFTRFLLRFRLNTKIKLCWRNARVTFVIWEYKKM